MRHLVTFSIMLLCFGWSSCFAQQQWVIRFNDGSEAAFDVNSIQEMFLREKTSDTNPQLRMAFYETVPGYSVRDLMFYTDATSETPQADVTLFANDTIISFGAVNYTAAEEHERTGTAYLGRTRQSPSYAGNVADSYYITYSPNAHGMDLTLRVDYSLEATDGSGEIIFVKGATVHVPARYTAWEPDHDYTYIFKIADYIDHWTSGQSLTELYRITLDAIEVSWRNPNIITR